MASCNFRLMAMPACASLLLAACTGLGDQTYAYKLYPGSPRASSEIAARQSPEDLLAIGQFPLESPMQVHDCAPSGIGVSRFRALLAAFAFPLLTTGCLMVPYTPPASTEHVCMPIPDPERLRLSVGPRRFLEAAAKEITEIDRRFQWVGPDTKNLIEPLDADFLVLIVQPETITVDQKGAMGPTPLGFLGLSMSKRSTSYWAAVIDTRRMELVEHMTSESVGNDTVVGFGGVIGVMSFPEASAHKESIRQIANAMAASRPSGAVRFVLLTVESIPVS